MAETESLEHFLLECLHLDTERMHLQAVAATWVADRGGLQQPFTQPLTTLHWADIPNPERLGLLLANPGIKVALMLPNMATRKQHMATFVQETQRHVGAMLARRLQLIKDLYPELVG
jgi:hypothetical protein